MGKFEKMEGGGNPETKLEMGNFLIQELGNVLGVLTLKSSGGVEKNMTRPSIGEKE